jgi:hypothetical protein
VYVQCIEELCNCSSTKQLEVSKLDKPLPNHTPEVSSPLKGSSVAYLSLCGSMCEMDIVGVKIHIMKPINALKVRHPPKESPFALGKPYFRKGPVHWGVMWYTQSTIVYFDLSLI